MKKEYVKKHHFEVFRFLILPISKTIQLRIDDDITSYDQLVDRKNSILGEILKSKQISFEHRNQNLSFRLETQLKDLIIFRINVKKQIKRSTRDFKEEQIDDFPQTIVAIDNDPQSQRIIVERNIRAFTKPATVAHLLEQNLTKYLHSYNLAIYIEPIYSSEDFWVLLDRYPNRVTQLRFELLRPNMSNISNTIDKEIKDLQLSVDSHKIDLALDSNKDSVLQISKDNQQIRGLVEYAAQGGGSVSLRIRGVKKRLKTKKHTVEITLDDIEISNATPDALINIFKELFDANN